MNLKAIAHKTTNERRWWSSRSTNFKIPTRPPIKSAFPLIKIIDRKERVSPVINGICCRHSEDDDSVSTFTKAISKKWDTLLKISTKCCVLDFFSYNREILIFTWRGLRRRTGEPSKTLKSLKHMFIAHTFRVWINDFIRWGRVIRRYHKYFCDVFVIFVNVIYH